MQETCIDIRVGDVVIRCNAGLHRDLRVWGLEGNKG